MSQSDTSRRAECKQWGVGGRSHVHSRCTALPVVGPRGFTRLLFCRNSYLGGRVRSKNADDWLVNHSHVHTLVMSVAGSSHWYPFAPRPQENKSRPPGFMCLYRKWGMSEGYPLCVPARVCVWCVPAPDCCAVSGVNVQSRLIWQTNRPQGGWGIDVCVCVCLIEQKEKGEGARASSRV